MLLEKESGVVPGQGASAALPGGGRALSQASVSAPCIQAGNGPACGAQLYCTRLTTSITAPLLMRTARPSQAKSPQSHLPPRLYHQTMAPV